MNYKWRTNPTVIAQYVMDKHVPNGSKIVLKPNEACVVLEGGRVAGVATQTEMEINPRLGAISRFFGKQNPSRSFLFVFLGPHDVMLPLNGKTSDGQQVQGMGFIRIMFDRESCPKLLQMAAKGTTTVTLADISRSLIQEASTKINQDILNTVTLEQLRSDVNVSKDIASTLQIALRNTASSFGFSISSAWSNWMDTETERLDKMQVDLENLARKNHLLGENEQEHADKVLSSQIRKFELLHNLHVAELTADAKKNAAAELAQIEANIEVDRAKWNQIRDQELRQANHNAELHAIRRNEQLAESMHAMELARNQLDTKQMEMDQNFANQERQQQMAQDNLKFAHDLEQDKLDSKTQRAMDMFAQVQENKRKRMEMDANREQDRLQTQSNMSDKMLDTLANIASSTNDSQVAIEALKQLAELRKSDVKASSDAYTTESEKSGDEDPKV